MNKIQQMHLDAITGAEYDLEDKQSNYVGFAEECSKVTEQIAIEFAEWLENAEFHKLKSGNWTKNFGLSEYSGKILFQEFLKTKQ